MSRVRRAVVGTKTGCHVLCRGAATPPPPPPTPAPRRHRNIEEWFALVCAVVEVVLRDGGAVES